jgi:hypothetical protein
MTRDSKEQKTFGTENLKLSSAKEITGQTIALPRTSAHQNLQNNH